MLKCEADCAGGAQWVATTLAQIASAPEGPPLVEAFWRPPYRLRPWLAWHWLTDRLTARAWQPDRVTEWLPTPPDAPRCLSVIFTPHMPWLSSQGRLAMVTRPWAIYIQTEFFRPDEPPSPPAVLVFAHELVHVRQGPLLAASILGELLAYSAQSQLRPFLAPGYKPSKIEESAVEAAAGFDLANWRQLKGDGRRRLREVLREWRQNHPAYRMAPLLPIV
jgi:hypothetical protein